MLPITWPKWAVILFAFGLVAMVMGVGVLSVPLARAMAPEATSVPTLPAINYAQPLSGECEGCHTDKQALLTSAESPENVDASYIDRAELQNPHSALGCITCHAGTGNEADKVAAHKGLIQDLSETHPQDCLLCHRNLPAQIPEDHLRTPHGKITDAVWEGSACGVQCSDCHGEVGHGFDPVTGGTTCSMSVCLDCHRERGLDAKLSDCNTCHTGPHDLALVMSCKDCHTSTDSWQNTQLGGAPSGTHGLPRRDGLLPVS